MKRNAIVRIVIFSITILVLLAILAAGLAANRLSWNFFGYSSKDTSSYTSTAQGETVTVDAAQVRSIEIDWVSGSITLQPGDVDAVTFSESETGDSRYAMVWKQSGSSLKIQFCRDTLSGLSTIQIPKKDLIITVPRDWQGTELDVDCASANLTVRDLTLREVDIDSASGECRFETCNVDSLDVDTASGDVTFSGTLKELDCDAASASVRAVLSNTPSRVDVDTASGDLDLTLPADCGFTVSIDAMSSDFSSDFETTTRNGSHVHGDGGCRISVSAMSGDVTIRKGQ